MEKSREYLHDLNNKLSMIHGKLYKVKKSASDDQMEELVKIENWCDESFEILKDFRLHLNNVNELAQSES